ncbi:endonuclease III domain-containing protein [Kallotenue papyrolyticum]|uniref:endonuclease III domain-containing protein n=1 Tax=Kallotenue papyrolyticum TaxID=1325125 RepID=UPI0004B5137D|nr:endonuclease III [Kallotenue papyrolyticum]
MTQLPPVDQARLCQVNRRLRELYGVPQPFPPADPLDELIATILSQNTADRNSERAWQRLRARYRCWEEVLDADPEELYEVIKPAGLGRIKAQRIQAVLDVVRRQRGCFELGFLCRLPLEEARQWLCALPGVGPKTAACVLCFACGLPALPVDTHVYRVSRRLGLIPAGVSVEAAHRLLEGALPAQDVFAFHINMIRHGRQICQARRPRCERCALSDLCAYYATWQRTTQEPEAAGLHATE